MEELVDQLLAFVQAVEDEEAAEVLLTHPELLSPEAYAALETWVPLNDHDPEVQERVLSRLAMLDARGLGDAGGVGEDGVAAEDPGLDSDDPSRRLAALKSELEGLDPEENFLEWAELEMERGVCHLDLRFDDPLNALRSATACFRQLCRDDLRQQQPELWCAAVNNLALAIVWSPAEQRAEEIEEAIRRLEQALKICRRRNLDDTIRARTWHHLGIAYSERLRGERSDNLEKAIDAYRHALRRRSRTAQPEPWARTMNDLGTAYLERVAGRRAENLEAAIDAFRQACEAREGEGRSPDWAGSAQNLATAHCLRIRGDRVANWEQAIELYEQVLEVRTPEAAPLRRAETLTNLANAYAQRLRGAVGDNLERAIALLTEALELLDPGDTQRRARTLVDLGNVYLDRLHRDRRHNLDRAVACHRQALELLPRDDRPSEWATAAENLANVLAERGEPGDRERAVDLYHQALDVHRRDEFPWVWARLHNSLGVTVEDSEVAEHHLRQALEVHAVELFPECHRRAARNLGDLLFRRRDWAGAMRAYGSALAATRKLYEAAHTTEARQRQVMEDLDVPARAAYCQARLAQTAAAVETLEASRTRQLAETLDLRRIAVDRLPPSLRERYLRNREELWERETVARDLRSWSQEGFLTASRELRRARHDLEATLELVQREHSDVLPAPMSAAEVAQCSRKLGHPLVYLLTTSHGTLALTVGGESDEPAAAFLDAFSSADLDDILEGESGLLPSMETKSPAGVEAALGSIWPRIRHLVEAVEERIAIPEAGRASLIPVGRLALLPFCAAGDRLVWNRLPAVRLLPPALERTARTTPDPRLLVVAAPGHGADAISGVVAEARRVARYGAGGSTVLSEEAATAEALKRALPRADILHFAGHGRFDDQQPLASSLLLTGRHRVTVREVLEGGLELGRLQLAVLSGCETGLVEHHYRVDEALGFSAAFLQAGVPTVVATLWPVDDVATTLLAGRFHHGLANGCGAAQALHQARCWLRDSSVEELGLVSLFEELVRHGDSGPQREALEERLAEACSAPQSRPFRSPYYWAAFTASGVG